MECRILRIEPLVENQPTSQIFGGKIRIYATFFLARFILDAF
jgi:hypothetical protein